MHGHTCEENIYPHEIILCMLGAWGGGFLELVNSGTQLRYQDTDSFIFLFHVPFRRVNATHVLTLKMLACLINCPPPPKGSKTAASTPGVSYKQQCRDPGDWRLGDAFHFRVSLRATAFLTSNNLPFLLGDVSTRPHQNQLLAKGTKSLLYFDQL